MAVCVVCCAVRSEAEPPRPASVSADQRQYSIQALLLLAEVTVTLLDVVYRSEEKERVIPLLSNILYNVFPYLKNHRSDSVVQCMISSLADICARCSWLWETWLLMAHLWADGSILTWHLLMRQIAHIVLSCILYKCQQCHMTSVCHSSQNVIHREIPSEGCDQTHDDRGKLQVIRKLRENDYVYIHMVVWWCMYDIRVSVGFKERGAGSLGYEVVVWGQSPPEAEIIFV